MSRLSPGYKMIIALFCVVFIFKGNRVKKKKNEKSSFLNKSPFMSSFMQDTFLFFPGMKQKDFHSSFCTFSCLFELLQCEYLRLPVLLCKLFHLDFLFKDAFESCIRLKQLGLVWDAGMGS